MPITPASTARPIWRCQHQRHRRRLPVHHRLRRHRQGTATIANGLHSVFIADGVSGHRRRARHSDASSRHLVIATIIFASTRMVVSRSPFASCPARCRPANLSSAAGARCRWRRGCRRHRPGLPTTRLITSRIIVNAQRWKPRPFGKRRFCPLRRYRPAARFPRQVTAGVSSLDGRRIPD